MNTTQQFDENTTDPAELAAMFEQMEKGDTLAPQVESEDTNVDAVDEVWVPVPVPKS